MSAALIFESGKAKCLNEIARGGYVKINRSGNISVPGLAWHWHILSRLAMGACSVVLAFLILSPIPGPFRVTYLQVNATYISQEILSPLAAPQLRVKVRYYLNGNLRLTAYIYPQYRALPSRHRVIPIYYLPSEPRTAYYAGPGGDENLRSSMLYPVAGVGLGVLGVYLLCSVLAWRRQVLAQVRMPNRRCTVRLRWHSEKNMQTTVVVTPHEGGMEYSWEVLPAKTPVDRVVVFLRNLSNVRSSFESASPALRRPESAELAGGLSPHQWLILRTDGQLILPVSRAEPLVGTSQSSEINANKFFLRVAHRELLAAYATVLGESQQLPAFIRPPSKSDSLPVLHSLRTPLCWRALVRLHVELDIRRQLKCLADAYIRSQMLITPSGCYAEQERRGIAELRDECQLLSTSLTNIRSRIVSVILGAAAVLPPLLVIIKVHQLELSILVRVVLLYIIWSLIFLPGIVALRAYIDAFSVKRRLFMSLGIYGLEDEVFAKLGQRKRVERMWDCYARTLVLAAWTALWIWQLLWSKSDPYPVGADTVVPLIIATTILAWWAMRIIRRRRLEER
jgi:hypothetical protein